MKSIALKVLGALVLAGAGALYMKLRRKTAELTGVSNDLSNKSRHLNPVFSKLKNGH